MTEAQRPRRGPNGLWYVPGEDESKEAINRFLADRLDADLRAVLKTKSGRRWLHAMGLYCRTDDDLHPFGTAFAGPGGERVQQAIIGMRHVGLWLRQRIRDVVSPELLEQMRVEYEDPSPDALIVVEVGEPPA